MSHNQCIEAPVLDLIPENIDKMNIVDCAFGYGLWGLFMRLRKNGTPIITGIELFEQHIKRMKNNKLYDNLVYASVANLPFREKSVDMTIACEVKEHLSREKGIMFLDDLDYITKGRTIVSTPRELYNYKIQSDDNKYNVHLSGWRAHHLSHLKNIVDPNIFLPYLDQTVYCCARAARQPHKKSHQESIHQTSLLNI